MPLFDRSREHRQIALCRSLYDLSIRIESRPVTLTVERVVLLRIQPAFSMRTIGRECDQFIAFADEKEPNVAESLVDAICSVVAKGACVDQLLAGVLRVCAPWVRSDCGCRCEQNKPPPVDSSLKRFGWFFVCHDRMI